MFAIPVGAAFHPTHLRREELAQLIAAAEGPVREQLDWEPSRSEIRVVEEPATGRQYQVRIVPGEGTGTPQGILAPASRAVLLFEERGGTWLSTIPLPAGQSMEALSRRDLLQLLWPVLDLQPLLSSPSRTALRPAAEESGSGSMLVLLVEDHSDLRLIYRSVLEKAGFGVIEARNGEEALALAKQYEGRLSVVVSDVVMPRVGGRELLWRLAEDHPALPVVLMSGLLSHEELARHLEPEPVWFLRKPFDPHDLVELVRRVLGFTPDALLPKQSG